MRTVSIIVIGAGVVLLSGCSHPMTPASSFGERTRFSWYGVSNDSTNSIPLPRQTPYDDDAGARAIYLQAYWEGYRFATEHPHFNGDGYHPQGPYAIPKAHGFSTGESDANRAAMDRRLAEDMRQAEDAIKRMEDEWQKRKKSR